MKVYVLIFDNWYAGESNPVILGVFETEQEAESAQSQAIESEKYSDGTFDIQEFELGKFSP